MGSCKGLVSLLGWGEGGVVTPSGHAVSSGGMHSNFFYFSLMHRPVYCIYRFVFFNFVGDTDSQQKVFEEMKQSGVKPNDHTYSELMKTYMLK